MESESINSILLTIFSNLLTGFSIVWNIRFFEQKTCSDIKYIKVPTVITKVIKVDSTGKVLSKKIQTDSPNVPEPEEREVIPVEEEDYKLPEKTKKVVKVARKPKPTKKTMALRWKQAKTI